MTPNDYLDKQNNYLFTEDELDSMSHDPLFNDMISFEEYLNNLQADTDFMNGILNKEPINIIFDVNNIDTSHDSNILLDTKIEDDIGNLNNNSNFLENSIKLDQEHKNIFQDINSEINDFETNVSQNTDLEIKDLMTDNEKIKLEQILSDNLYIDILPEQDVIDNFKINNNFINDELKVDLQEIDEKLKKYQDDNNLNRSFNNNKLDASQLTNDELRIKLTEINKKLADYKRGEKIILSEVKNRIYSKKSLNCYKKSTRSFSSCELNHHFQSSNKKGNINQCNSTQRSFENGEIIIKQDSLTDILKYCRKSINRNKKNKPFLPEINNDK